MYEETPEKYCPDCGSFALIRVGLVADGCLIYDCLSCCQPWEIRKSKDDDGEAHATYGFEESWYE